MRRLFSVFVVVFSVVVLTGCRHNGVTSVEDVETIDYVYRTEYDGHKYIVFKHNGLTNPHNMSGVVHDPDCPCTMN